MGKYTVTIKTGDQDAAGTNANISLVLHGVHDSVGPLKLDKTWTNDFESGSEDEYPIQIKDIGTLTSMELRTDNSGGSGCGWFVEWVKIVDHTDGAEHNFRVNQWMNFENVTIHQAPDGAAPVGNVLATMVDTIDTDGDGLPDTAIVTKIVDTDGDGAADATVVETLANPL